jgi:hypothetical protein
MSISWSNFRIQEVDSKKIYFRKYHFKLEVSTNLAPYLRGGKGKLDRQHVTDYVARHNRINYNYGGSWGHRHYTQSQSISQSTQFDVSEIIDIGTVLRAHDSSIKYTIEDTNLRIFTDSEQVAYDIATAIKTKTGRLGFYAAIWKPDVSLTDKIDEGYEILTRDPGYTHKVVLRDRMIGAEAKHQIFNYLESLGDVVKITNGVRNIMSSKGAYLFSCWFRTDDTTITTFLELICPGIVQKIVPVYVKNK